MDVDRNAASGPEVDNAGTTGDDLSDAISAAIGVSEDSGMAEQLQAEQRQAETPEPQVPDGDATALDPEIAGDDANDENAPALDAKTPEDAGLSDEDKNTSEAPSAPKHWPKERKEAFDAMPPQAQSAMLAMAKDLEGGFTRKSQDQSDKIKFADQVSGLVDDQTRSQIQAAGSNEAGYFQYLHQTQQFASKDPVGYVKWAMQNLGVTPDHIGLSQEHSQAEPDAGVQVLDPLLMDPAVKQLQDELREVKEAQRRRDEREQNFERSQYASQVTSIQNEIGSFRSQQDDSGQLRYPHFDAVQRHMGALMDTDPDLAGMPDGQDKLQKAYDMAVWARPDLRESLLETETSRRSQDQQKREAASRAKRATGVKPASGAATVPVASNSLDDAISASISKHGL